MKRLPILLLLFAILSLVFFLLLVLLRQPFPPYPLISYQDALDLLTPVVLIPMYWLLFQAASDEPSSLWQQELFMALASIWSLGQGMHLAANSIDNLIEGLARTGQLDITDSSVYQLTYFFDEHLSHIVWHLGIIGLAVLLLVRAWRGSPGVLTSLWPVYAGALLYGITLFCIFLEGQTVALGLPSVGAIVLTCILRGRSRIGRDPLIAFFFASCALALILFVGWGIYWRGFPQFSDVGLL